MHLVILKLPVIFVTVWEELRSISFHFTLFEFTFVLGSVSPGHDTFAIHIVIFEFSFEKLA